MNRLVIKNILIKIIFYFFLFLDIKDLSQKITRYLKTSQRTLALPVGEVMLNRKGRL